MNNVNTTGINAFVEQIKKDPALAKKQKKVTVDWNLDESKPQASAVLEFPKGSITVEADMPPPLGGQGRKPDPVQYCLFGTASCFASTFATICSEKKITLRKLKVTAENSVNLTQPLGMGKMAIVEKVVISVEVSSDGTKNQLSEIEKESRERCPGVYCLTHAILLETNLKMG